MLRCECRVLAHPERPVEPLHIEVEADSVPVLMFAPEGVIEERRAPKASALRR